MRQTWFHSKLVSLLPRLNHTKTVLVAQSRFHKSVKHAPWSPRLKRSAVDEKKGRSSMGKTTLHQASDASLASLQADTDPLDDIKTKSQAASQAASLVATSSSDGGADIVPRWKGLKNIFHLPRRDGKEKQSTAKPNDEERVSLMGNAKMLMHNASIILHHGKSHSDSDFDIEQVPSIAQKGGQKVQHDASLSLVPLWHHVGRPLGRLSST